MDEGARLAVGLDSKNRSPPIPDIENAFGIEGETGRRAELVGDEIDVATRRDAVDGPLFPARNIETVIRSPCETGRVQDVAHERLNRIVAINAVDRHGNFFTTAAAEGHI